MLLKNGDIMRLCIKNNYSSTKKIHYPYGKILELNLPFYMKIEWVKDNIKYVDNYPLFTNRRYTIQKKMQENEWIDEKDDIYDNLGNFIRFHKKEIKQPIKQRVVKRSTVGRIRAMRMKGINR